MGKASPEQYILEFIWWSEFVSLNIVY